ncbi:MAG: AAA family ATPase [Lysobacterales bacterium]
MSDEARPQDPVSAEPKSRRLTLALSSLFLDPNNYRFIDHDDYVLVPESDMADEDVQRRTRRLIVGPNAELVEDLIASFMQNGWLDVEPIHVRRLGERKYLVVEGNRRVATLKHLYSRWQETTGRLGKLDPSLFEKVPCILYDEKDEFHHLVVMGLHHISGKRRWPAVNQARLMKRLRDSFHKQPDEICASLGVSKREFNLSTRTLALVDAFRTSDYGDQFSSDMFNLFREVLKAPSIRDWLEWNNEKEGADNVANLERLFSWLSREPEEDEGEDAPANVSGDPVITTGGQIRELARIIEDPEAVKRLEETRSLQAATLSSDLLVKNEIDAALARSNDEVTRLFQLATKMSKSELDRVEELASRLEAVAISRKRQPATASGSERPWQTYTDLSEAQFRSVRIDHFRGVTGISLDGLGRVNLLVGINNAGKTSVLEAIYLLANQSDPRALLELIRRRTRIDPLAFQSWTVNQFPSEVRLSGKYDLRANDNVAVLIKTKDDPDDSEEDRATYLRTLVIEASYSGRSQTSVTDFFEGRTRRTRLTGEPRWLCQSVFHSPFSLSEPDLLARCNEASIKAKSKERVLDFVRTHLDAGVQDIALANEYNRFLVTHKASDEAVDLSSFGEGVQRVFLTGLLIAGARGGVVLIDEFENALHTNVLPEFTKFIHELAVDFNCQLFLTTHSKETVDAFLLNEYRTHEVTAYLLKTCDGLTRTATSFRGPALKKAIEVGDVDLRRL